MLSRHFLRAKALQATYAYATSASSSIREAEKLFVHNINRLNDLGVMQLSMLLETHELAARIADDGQRKFMPTEEERKPNLRFVENSFLVRLADNYELRKYLEHNPAEWSTQSEAFRKVFNQFRATELYTRYMEASDVTFEDDKHIAIELFRCLVNDDALRDAMADKQLLWEDDYDQVAQYNFMALKEFEESTMNASTHLPLMHDSTNEGDVLAYDFARHIFLTAIQHISDNEPLIRKHLQNWEFERVALMDILLINLAIAEFTDCPSIPERVTVNEYIELSKEFSTDKSKLFINGILDKILIELRVAGRVNKSGRGLYDPTLLDEEGKEN